MLRRNGWTDGLCPRSRHAAARDRDMVFGGAATPVRVAIGRLGMGATIYGRRQDGRVGQAATSPNGKRPSPETIPVHLRKAAGLLYDLGTPRQTRGKAKGCSDGAVHLDYARATVAKATGGRTSFS